MLCKLGKGGEGGVINLRYGQRVAEVGGDCTIHREYICRMSRRTDSIYFIGKVR
jgi:hypothetical protein